MQQKTLFCSLVVVLVAYCTLSAANTMLGGAKDAKIDSHTEEVANFAVTQLNGKANFPIQGSLKLGRIVSAKTQVRSAFGAGPQPAQALLLHSSSILTTCPMHAGCCWHQPHPAP